MARVLCIVVQSRPCVLGEHFPPPAGFGPDADDVAAVVEGTAAGVVVAEEETVVDVAEAAVASRIAAEIAGSLAGTRCERRVQVEEEDVVL